MIVLNPVVKMRTSYKEVAPGRLTFREKSGWAEHTEPTFSAWTNTT